MNRAVRPRAVVPPSAVDLLLHSRALGARCSSGARLIISRSRCVVWYGSVPFFRALRIRSSQGRRSRSASTPCGSRGRTSLSASLVSLWWRAHTASLASRSCATRWARWM
jgi:hypothetical protein